MRFLFFLFIFLLEENQVSLWLSIGVDVINKACVNKKASVHTNKTRTKRQPLMHVQVTQ